MRPSRGWENSDIYFKDLYSCPVEIIEGITDKGQFQFLTGLRGDLPVYNNYFHLD